MGKIEIEWLSDSNECDQCGGNWAEGAVVRIDGKLAIELIPHAGCTGGDNYDERDVFTLILDRLGFELVTN